jgi:hypothetical protein
MSLDIAPDPLRELETPESPAARASGALAALPGAVLGAAFGLAAVVRRTKPLHPHGRVGTGILEVTDPLPELGVPLLAGHDSHSCLVRWSRSVGLPDPLPDVEGFAVRFDEPTADLLFAGTGTGRLTRYIFAPRTPQRHGPQTTIFPVSSVQGPLLFRVTPVEGRASGPPSEEPPACFELAVSVDGPEWRAVGHLDCVWGPDRPMRFDPVENVLPGTGQYPVVRMLREPAYLMARRGTVART